MLGCRALVPLGATLLDVYPHVRVYRASAVGGVLFLASDAPIEPERVLARTGEPLATEPELYRSIGIHGVDDVALMLAYEREGLVEFCRGVPVNTDDHNRIATRSGQQRSDERLSGSLANDPLVLRSSRLNTDPTLELDRVYLAGRAAQLGWLDRAAAIVEGIEESNLIGDAKEVVNALIASSTIKWICINFKSCFSCLPNIRIFSDNSFINSAPSIIFF